MYFVVGGMATVIDWSIYALWLAVCGKMHYLSGLVISLAGAGLFHYVANKRLTFQCDSRRFVLQISLYVMVDLLGLGMSMLILAGLVRGVGLLPFPARGERRALRSRFPVAQAGGRHASRIDRAVRG